VAPLDEEGEGRNPFMELIAAIKDAC